MLKADRRDLPVKKLALVLLLVLGMSLSFAAIGLVMLFALDVVESPEEVRALVLGEMPGSESVYLKPGEVQGVEDALLLLQQQKQQLEQDILDLKDKQGNLLQSNASLLDSLGVLRGENQVNSQGQATARAGRLDQMITLYDAMRPADAAGIMDGLSDELILEILPRLKQRQAARILNGLGDDARKARLTTLLVDGQTAKP